MTPIELLAQAHAVITSAMDSGDWTVDGACDPDCLLIAIEIALRDAGFSQNAIDGEWQQVTW